MNLYKNEDNTGIMLDNNQALSIEESRLLDDIESLVEHLASHSIELLPDYSNKIDIRNKLYDGVRSGLNHLVQSMKCTDLICIDDEILISFSSVHELYKSIPKIIVENFRNIKTIIMHVHVCCQIDESQVSFEHHTVKSYDLKWNDILQFPNGDIWYCADNGSTFTIESFTALIGALDSIARFTKGLQKIVHFLGEATIIMVDEIVLINEENESTTYVSVEDFISDYLSIGNYRFDFNWYWRIY